MDVNSGESTRLAQGMQPSWSPDGGGVVFIRDGNVFTIASDGTDEKRITASPLPFVTTPLWSPSGDALGLTYSPGVDTQVQVVNLDGTGETPIAWGGDVGWASDGSVTFVSGFAGLDAFSGYLYTASPDGSNIAAVAPISRGGVILSCSGGASYEWSKDASRLAYRRGEGVRVVSRADPDRPLFEASGSAPTLSPDGQKIAFTSGMSECAIHTNILDQNVQPKILFEDGQSPSWSPDGESIAFVRKQQMPGTKQETLSILLGNSSTGESRVVASFNDQPYAFPPLLRWSPDGRRLTFEVQGLIYALSADSGDINEIAKGTGPAWSRDNEEIAFSAGSYNDVSIYVVSADGGDPRLVSKGRVPAWSPDGTQIAFTR